MAFKLILLVLPVFTLAAIDIGLSGTFPDDLDLTYTGQEIDIITDEERRTFRLSDSNLKKGINVYFGKTPTDVYVRSPTPWGDLYKSYGWREVTTTLVPTNARVLSIKDRDHTVLQQVFENNSTKSGTFNVGISQTVTNTMSSSWSKTDGLSVSQEINYEMEMGFGKIGGKTTLGYTAVWGQGTEKSKSVVIGATSHVDMVLEPGQAVIAMLQAKRGTMKVEVQFEASLSGQLAVNYEKPYKGHHFWPMPVDAVMSSADLSNSMTSKQIIEIGFFYNSKITVYDSDLKKMLMNVAV